MTHHVKLEDIRHDYQNIAESYDARWAKFLDSAHSWVMNHLEQPQNIIDIGCGTGRLLHLIQQEYPDATLTGLDGTPEMLSIAREKLPKTTLEEADLSDIKIKGQFDVVLSINVLHHLNSPADHVGSLRQLCTANGTVFVCDFAINTLSLKLAEHYWRLLHPAHHMAYSSKQLRPLIEKHFTIEEEAVLQPDWFWRLQVYRLKP